MTRSSGIFRSPAARERMRHWYDRFLARLPAPAARTTLDTRCGPTHVLTYGPPEAPPLLCLHGALAGAPHALFELRGLLDHYRVFAPDIVGQSVASAEVRPRFDADGFGGWAQDVVQGLGLSRTHVLGISWGGAVALQLAIHAPALVDRLALLVPAGIVSGSPWRALVKVGWPMLRWRLRPTRERLEAMLRATLTTLDPMWVEFMGDAFASVTMDFSAPPLVRPEPLRGFDRPAMVIAAQHDLSFPAAAMMKRAPQILPGLTQTHVIEGSKHCPPFDDAFRGWLCDTLRDFLGPDPVLDPTQPASPSIKIQY